MKNILKTASIVTSGIIVGALVRKYAFQGLASKKKSVLNSIQSVKNGISTKALQDDMNEFFV
jgi:hypothetical protein